MLGDAWECSQNLQVAFHALIQVYMKDRTVVWSKGSDQQSRILIKSFTVGSEAKDCFWCKFTIPSSNENQGKNSLLKLKAINAVVVDHSKLILNVGCKYE